jgi:hypothetical protein
VDQVITAPEPKTHSAAKQPAAKAERLVVDRPVPLSGGGAVIAAYAVTIFTSAFLLFQVQPLISKFILPWFGGSPAVWTAAMLFFQVVLFGGYLYAHLTSSYLKPRGQFVLHLSLLAFAAALAVYTRISPSDGLKPTGDEASPLMQVLLVLAASVGVPYFALSSTGPLLQKWFSDAFEGASPYRLFALSNVGSLLALLTYPFFFEVYWDSREQAFMWSLGFVVFAACCAFCAWWTFRARRAQAVSRPVARATDGPTAAVAPSWWLRAAWIGLPMLASIMFLAVTNEVCQNVATVPLLWIIPLSFYLLSFIIAFDHPRWYVRPLCAIGAMVLLVYVSNFTRFTWALEDGLTALLGRTEANAIELDSWILEISMYFVGLLSVCLICHCELAALKPSPKYLTGYFLSMSLGGALGGIFVNLVAVNIFDTFFEMPLAFLASIGIAGWLLIQWARRFGQPAVSVAGLASAGALAAVFYFQIVGTLNVDPNANHLTIHRDRSFFGIVSVQHRSRKEAVFENFTFRSGHVPHGKQYADPARRNDTVLAYWGPDTGCRLALEYKVKAVPNCRIGVVGLGVGTIAAFAKESDYVRFYEINPQVTDIANEYFYFLKDCKTQLPVDVVHGDARLKLEQEKNNEFDVLCLDAFSGDAVPTHLLTTEAFATYKRHIKPNGIIVCNITNSYLDLWPVIKRLADEHGFKTARIYRPSDRTTLVERSYYAIVTNDEAFLGPVMAEAVERARPLIGASVATSPIPQILIDMPANFQKKRDIPLWTDRYHNLFQVLR